MNTQKQEEVPYNERSKEKILLETVSQASKKKPFLTGLMQLIITLAVVWGLTFIVLPAITRSSATFQQLASFIDRSEIDTGQFYYTDVEVVTQADNGVRSTMEYFAGKTWSAKADTMSEISPNTVR